MDRIRDNLEFYTNFDILCFNETNCNMNSLPFEGRELALEGFHEPILQAPARTSSKGGGLAIYVNKNFANAVDIIVRELVENSSPQGGEFLVIEIKNARTRNTIICNYYRSPNSDVAKFIDKINSVMAGLN